MNLLQLKIKRFKRKFTNLLKTTFFNKEYLSILSLFDENCNKETSVIELYGFRVFKSFYSEFIYLLLFHRLYIFTILKNLKFEDYFIYFKKHWEECRKNFLNIKQHNKFIKL